MENLTKARPTLSSRQTLISITDSKPFPIFIWENPKWNPKCFLETTQLCEFTADQKIALWESQSEEKERDNHTNEENGWERHRETERQRETDFDEAGQCMNVNLITRDNPLIQLLPNKTFMAVFGIDPENAFDLQIWSQCKHSSAVGDEDSILSRKRWSCKKEHMKT